jgi:tRNA A-37 threonylcarbamoyl transferase component Bud32/GAF domain-containing protein
MSDQPRRPAFFWLVLVACLLFAFAVSMTVYVSIRHYGPLKAPGWNVRAERSGWLVTDIDRRGPASSQLEDGDRVLAINGDERPAIVGVSYWRNVRGGATYRLDLERRGERVSVELPLPLGPGRPFDNVFTLYALVFFACGAALGLLRPGDGQVRLVASCLMVLGIATLTATLATIRGFLEGWEVLAYFALVALAPCVYPLTYHVFCRFPTGQHPGALWQAMQWLLYALFVLVFWPAWILHYLGVDIGARATLFLVDHPSLYLTGTRVGARESYLFFVLCLVLAMVVTARNYRRLDSPDSRRRIRLVVVGLMIALIPFALATFAYRFTGAISEENYRRYLGPIAFLPMICIPLSLAAAVWKEQLFDIKVLVRRGLQYLFARAALRTLLVLPVALLLFSIFRNPNRTVVQILTEGSGWLNVVLIAAIGAALQSRQRLQTTLDRRFFREAYQQEQVLAHLIDEVRQRDSLADIAKLVGARIDSVLHPTALHVFYRADERSGRFERHSSSDAAIAGLPASFDGCIEDIERQWLEQSAGHLAVPITGTGDRVVGVLLLGDRKSDEPYSVTDRRLLQGIASQIGLVYENQHLKERVRRDADVRRDVLARLEDRRVSLLKECPVCGRCYDGATERCDADGVEVTLTLPVERTLDGKYRLERALGRGGFGAVFEASDLRLHRRVAVKVMMGSLFGDQTALRRFEREARAAARIDHRNITRVHDYGAVGSGGAFLVMELVAGRTWRAELQRSGVVPPARSSEWFRQLLDGLQFAHSMGIVHRDLKPENVMIVESPTGHELKIMDFGLAKVLDSGTGVTESVTVAGKVMGTLGYMAPEVVNGDPVDERADIFAIGVMVVETLTGSRPFRGPTQQEILLALLQSEYHLPGESAEIRALDVIVQRCLAKDPRDRYRSAAELAKDLVPALARCAGFGGPYDLTLPDSRTI